LIVSIINATNHIAVTRSRLDSPPPSFPSHHYQGNGSKWGRFQFFHVWKTYFIMGKTDLLILQCPKVTITSGGFRYTYHQGNCPGYGDTSADIISVSTVQVPTKTHDLAAFSVIVIPGGPTLSYGGHTKASSITTIAKPAIHSPISTTSPKPSLGPILQSFPSQDDPIANRKTSRDPLAYDTTQLNKVTFKALSIVLGIAIIVVGIMLWIIGKDK
jgi:hypothetical protein